MKVVGIKFANAKIAELARFDGVCAVVKVEHEDSKDGETIISGTLDIKCNAGEAIKTLSEIIK